jgi:kinesin family protein 13
VSEPAILVKCRDRSNQVWSVEKLELRLMDMRSLSEDTHDDAEDFDEDVDHVFYDVNETHHLIGVANLFLGCVFQDVAFSYLAPIISQQGDVCGRLQVEVQRVGGVLPSDRLAHCDNSSVSEASSDMSRSSDEDPNTVTIRVSPLT